MACFQVVISGTNVLVNLDGLDKRVGFVTTRIVNTPDSEKARLAAIAVVRESVAGNVSILNLDKSEISVEATEINPIPIESASEYSDTGLIFYDPS